MIKVSSPSNIALIKYMGKTDTVNNIPTNSSLSWSIDHLRTYIELEVSNIGADSWAPLTSEYSMNLSKSSVDRFLNFWTYLKDKFSIDGYYVVKSANNFPYGCGLASSASSFSALTKAAYELSLKNGGKEYTSSELGEISSKGSGSSCRSLENGWVIWKDGEIKKKNFPYNNLLHKVIVVESGEKKISSSQAHKLVAGSSLFPGRPERAEMRLQKLSQALINKNWKEAYQVIWSEFWDMHALFETSKPNFGYMNGKTIDCLNIIRSVWEQHSDGPLVTMDAGPNVHFLFREDQKSFCEEIMETYFGDFKVL